MYKMLCLLCFVFALATSSMSQLLDEIEAKEEEIL